MLFSICIGMGLQYSIVSLIFLIVASIGMQMGAHMREYLYLLFLALSALTGSIGGYMSSRLYKFFNGTAWFRHMLSTVFFIPTLANMMLGIMTIVERMELNRFGEYRKAEFDKVFLVWTFFDIFNVGVGCWLGYRADKISVPVKNTRLKRSVPSFCQTPFYA